MAGATGVERNDSKTVREPVVDEACIPRLKLEGVSQNAALGIEVLGTLKNQALRDARAILTEFGLATLADHYPAQPSGAMRQRVAPMRTLLCKREPLHLDEPVGALDTLTRAVMQEWLLGTWQRERRMMLPLPTASTRPFFSRKGC